MKYIAPVKGTKMPIYTDDNQYHANERRRHCAVEMWERDGQTGEIKYPATKCEWINFIRTVEEENALNAQLLLKQMSEQNDLA